MMQKKLAAGLAVLLAAGMALSSCGESGAAGNDSVSDAAGNEAAALTEAKTTPYGRYPETITYTLAKMTGVNNSNLPEGETYEDNAYTRLIREIINVHHTTTFGQPFSCNFSARSSAAFFVLPYTDAYAIITPSDSTP